MKTGFWDRILIYLYLLITLIVTAVIMLRAFGLDLIQLFIDGLDANMPGIFWRIIFIGICVMIGLLGVYAVSAITPRRRKHDFVTLNSDDGGKVMVSLPAIREMAGQSIRNIKGLEAVVIDVTEASDSIRVNVNMDVESGVHVPSVTADMKRSIKTNIERSCGVDVSSVNVEVRRVLPASADNGIEQVKVVPVITEEAPAAPDNEIPEAEEDLSVSLYADSESEEDDRYADSEDEYEAVGDAGEFADEAEEYPDEEEIEEETVEVCKSENESQKEV